jgi:hypothetical protein
MANRGLSVSGVVNVTVNISPIAAGLRNFGTALIIGSNDVIDTSERLRFYRTLDEVAAEHSSTTAEYKAAELYFSQAPRPNALYIGRWVQAAAPAILHGGVLLPTEQDIVGWNAITTGSMAITVGGTTKTLTAMNFSAATNLNGVASIIQAATTGIAVTWDANNERFDIRSTATGVTATISYASATGSGTDISARARLTSTTASVPVGGSDIETPLVAAQAAADRSGDWYGLIFATNTPPSDNALLDVAAYIEGTERSRILGITTQNTQVLDPLIASDIASRLKLLRYKRSCVQYSSQHPSAVASLFGRAFTVNFEANNTALTMKFKQEPGVVAETLTETQARALRNKNCNVFINYDNDTAIVQEGVMSNGYFFDEVHGLDWLGNSVQNDVWNLLYQSQTKIPQTDAGIGQIATVVEAAMSRAVNNGLVAPGVWLGPDIGILKYGMTLMSGFYVYAPPVATQSQSDREARKSPPIQVALKLAGAVHFADVIISVNR